jgi:hypothetical protein
VELNDTQNGVDILRRRVSTRYKPMKTGHILLVVIMSFFGLFGCRAKSSPETDFWNWFRQNESMLFDFENDRDRAFDLLASEMHKIHPSLTFEFGPKQGDRRDFVISADGIREAFPKVESLYAAAPSMARWKIIKFRPRREPMDIDYAGISVKADAIRVLLRREGPRAGITVLIPGCNQEQNKTYMGIAFLMLDQALGEYDVETRVGTINVNDLPQNAAGSSSLKDLPKAFDNLLLMN